MLRKYYKRNDLEVCLNWWPLPLGVIVDMSKENPICRLCGNWLIEKGDIVDIIKNSTKINTKCINAWRSDDKN
jgi:hypothetical protein